MEESARHFCTELRSFCSRLETHCTDLRTRIGQAPAPGANKSNSAFLEQLNGKVTAFTSMLESLKTMSMGTVSFQELLGHCNELFKQNDQDIQVLEKHLQGYGYNQTKIIAEETEDDDVKPAYLHEPDGKPSTGSLSPYLEALSLKDLGLSASSLAALSNKEREKDIGTYLETGARTYTESAETVRDVKPREYTLPQFETSDVSYSLGEGDIGYPENNGKAEEDPSSLLKVSDATVHIEPVTTEEFNAAPSWLKWQVSLEVLNEFISKVNLLLCSRKGISILKSDDLSQLAYAAQVQKACLLLLVRLQRLETGFHEGVTTYTVK